MQTEGIFQRLKSPAPGVVEVSTLRFLGMGSMAAVQHRCLSLCLPLLSSIMGVQTKGEWVCVQFTVVFAVSAVRFR